jgi:sec-independent protein translocase protein TatA
MTGVGIFGLGPTEMIIILVIVLIIFGAGRLPEIGSALGKGIREFKKSSDGQQEEAAEEEEEEPKPKKSKKTKKK